MEWTPSFVLRALNLRWEDTKLLSPTGIPENWLERYSEMTTDSRTVSPKSLFIPIEGENFDGHAFIPEAFEKGAIGTLCRSNYDTSVLAPPHPARVIPVQDPVQAFRSLSSQWRAQFTLPLVGIAGSMGKTTTKELLAAILSGQLGEGVFKTEGSQNGYLGLPLTLSRLSKEHQAAVIEIGIDDQHAMEDHLELVRPSAGLVTGIAKEHLEQLRDIETVAREEGKLLAWTAAHGGPIAINQDDPWLAPYGEFFPPEQVLRFSMNQRVSPDERQLKGSYLPDSEQLVVSGGGWHEECFNLPLEGYHNAQNLLAALSVALNFGLSSHEIRKGLANFQAPAGRSSWQVLNNNARILCDYYNASPTSLLAAFDLLKEQAKKEKAADPDYWLCLGDMLELGPYEAEDHRKIASWLRSYPFQHVLLYGERMKNLKDELESEAQKRDVQHFTSHEALADTLVQNLSKDSYVLIKGSRSMQMETIWHILKDQIGKKAR